ncbi:MAG: ATP-binding protein [Bifidobacteriaceae bacterium]|jgi:predicted AAA+ superfamily ATPase|nr:ATP-binding protein [Bifidobacteriaceae bacterium]
MKYRPRVSDRELRDRLTRAGAVVIEGPKGCGKTWSARQVAASELRVDVDPQVTPAMEADPAILLRGPVPRLLDEWQLQPRLWDFARRAIDDRSEPGQFVLTGSAQPNDDVRRHSGAGRMSRMRMHTMSLFETGASTGEASLARLLTGEPPEPATSTLSVSDIAALVCAGGWPATLEADRHQAALYARDYVDLLVDVDVSRVDGKRRDPVRLRRLLRSLARNTACEVSVETLTKDVAGPDVTAARGTIIDYLDTLARLMVTEDQPAWSAALRSKATLRRRPKRHFVDPSLAAAAVAATPDTLLQDLNFLGTLFESLAVRDLRIYAQALKADICHVRDSNGKELDAVIVLPDGGWAGVEIKLGAGAADQAAASLLAFAATVDPAVEGKPRALIAITGNGYAMRRADGVDVVPLGLLGP